MFLFLLFYVTTGRISTKFETDRLISLEKHKGMTFIAWFHMCIVNILRVSVKFIK